MKRNAGQFAKRASFTRSVKETRPASPGHGTGPLCALAGTAGLAVSLEGGGLNGVLPHFSSVSTISSHAAKLLLMKIDRSSTDAKPRIAPAALSVIIDIDPLVAAVRRHVKLTPQTTRLIKGEFAQLFQQPKISGSTRKATPVQREPSMDPVLSTQAAADLVGVSRPYIVARIEAGDIPLHQQVGNQRRVLQSAVLAWHRQEQARRRQALGRLGADLDAEIFAGRDR